MATKAADEHVHSPADTTNSMKSVEPNENKDTLSLPSPPSSVKATESDSGRKENDPHSTEAAGGEPSAAGSSSSAPNGANGGMTSAAAVVGLQADCYIS